MLKDISFFGKDHKHAYRHIDEVLEIVNYFNIPNVTRDAVFLRMLPVTFKGAVKDWLNHLNLELSLHGKKIKKRVYSII